MIISCAQCDKEMDTKKEKIIVTVEWIVEELNKLNEIKHNKELPRVVKICNDCWTNVFKKKPEKEDYFWEFSEEV